MGSKRWMLRNGLGSILDLEASKAKRFVDLFAGSGSVSSYVAGRFNLPVLAFDLQQFSAVLTGAVINRTEALSAATIWEPWLQRAKNIFDVYSPPIQAKVTKKSVGVYRAWSASQINLQVTKAYGGHYFSPVQAVWIDALRKTLPKKEPDRTVALASLIQAASQCAAAPGHTAQPFQPSRTAKKFLKGAWEMDVVGRTKKILSLLSQQCANNVGRAKVAEANTAAKSLRVGDLAFIDPPYSGVHYSRFYHVLETIAQGACGPVSGVGRYPDAKFRPRSKYSVSTESAEALDGLLKTVAAKGATAVFTFPSHECSNGLSGELVRKAARKYFKTREKIVKSKFSTLGGNGKPSQTGKKRRAARRKAKELILVLKPKSS